MSNLEEYYIDVDKFLEECDMRFVEKENMEESVIYINAYKYELYKSILDRYIDTIGMEDMEDGDYESMMRKGVKIDKLLLNTLKKKNIIKYNG